MHYDANMEVRKLVKLVLSYMEPGDQVMVTILYGKCHYPLSHLIALPLFDVQVFFFPTCISALCICLVPAEPRRECTMVLVVSHYVGARI